MTAVICSKPSCFGAHRAPLQGFCRGLDSFYLIQNGGLGTVRRFLFLKILLILIVILMLKN